MPSQRTGDVRLVRTERNEAGTSAWPPPIERMTRPWRTRDAWLSLTPEPERELPAAVAALRARGAPAPGAVERERARAQRLLLHGGERRWLAWLAEAVALAERARDDPDPAVRAAVALVKDVVGNHHALLLGLPGRSAERAADIRARVAAL